MPIARVACRGCCCRASLYSCWRAQTPSVRVGAAAWPAATQCQSPPSTPSRQGTRAFRPGSSRRTTAVGARKKNKYVVRGQLGHVTARGRKSCAHIDRCCTSAISCPQSDCTTTGKRGHNSWRGKRDPKTVGKHTDRTGRKHREKGAETSHLLNGEEAVGGST